MLELGGLKTSTLSAYGINFSNGLVHPVYKMGVFRDNFRIRKEFGQFIAPRLTHGNSYDLGVYNISK